MEERQDLISRQAAIDALHMLLMYRMGTDSNKKRLDDWINGVPSVQPERKKGNWVWKNKKKFCPIDCWFPPTGFEDTWNEKEGSWIEKELYCSECNFENWEHYKLNFCPNCGADMRGEQDG